MICIILVPLLIAYCIYVIFTNMDKIIKWFGRMLTICVAIYFFIACFAYLEDYIGQVAAFVIPLICIWVARFMFFRMRAATQDATFT